MCSKFLAPYYNNVLLYHYVVLCFIELLFYQRSIYHRQERELFDFRSDVPPLLLILDRKDDPVTPLLNQVILT